MLKQEIICFDCSEKKYQEKREELITTLSKDIKNHPMNNITYDCFFYVGEEEVIFYVILYINDMDQKSEGLIYELDRVQIEPYIFKEIKKVPYSVESTKTQYFIAKLYR